ncbi:hypothetical protein N431DRAFT_429544 [Stipitochalara longipes BDJ]|nr:hypothetical protein N431DRAFT_429544 [Stipitochalara longipes BDJ]
MAVSNATEFGIGHNPLLAQSLSLKSIAILNMDRLDLQKAIRSQDGLRYDKIVVGAIILRDSKILLLKRAPHEIYYPNVFELPSGNVKSTDPTLGYMHWYERSKKRQVSGLPR